MPYKLAHPSKLSPPTLFTTVEDASAAGREFWPKDVFHVKQVREARLSDYFTLPDLVSSLRERMQFISGDDSPMDARIATEDGLPNEGELVFDDPDLAETIRHVLDTFAEIKQLDLSAMLIVEADYVIRPE